MKNGHSLIVTTPTDHEIVMTRIFEAPKRLVWDAHTKPELLKRWLGVFGDWELAECEIDLRVGGSLRYVWRNRANGTVMGMSGVYREIVTHERIVSTEQFDDPWYEGEAYGTLQLREEEGRTTLIHTVHYATKAIRDMVLQSGMEGGVAKSYDKLEAEVLSA